MAEGTYISKKRTLLPAEDFQYLRTEGMKYIEELSAKSWTDYNLHDPGITILEALCYAITELSYRTGLNINDLLADKDGKTNTNQAFFTARDILSNEPVTVEDYRKLLIDITGVHNAWMTPLANIDDADSGNPVLPEVPIYPFCEEDKLIYQPTHHEAIGIRGLYQILLDLDQTEEHGDLNSGNILFTFKTGELQNVQVEAIMARWNEVNFEDLGNIVNGDISPDSYTVTEGKGVWEIAAAYHFSTHNIIFTYSVVVALKQQVDDLEKKIKNELEKIGFHNAIFTLYYTKIGKTIAVIKEAVKTFHAHRCLCEDLKSVDTVKPVEIAICADIEVKPEADIEQVLAEIYFAVENYFHPDLHFYSLKEMLDKGISSEEIFEGPKLEHGFVLNDELAATQLRTAIHVSDIINQIMDISGVRAVKNVMLTGYDQTGQPYLANKRWCLELESGQKPVLSINRSKLLFFRDKLPYRAKAAETADILSLLRGISERTKLAGDVDDISVPGGTYYQLDDYYSVQYEFPQNYGISKWGLPASASEARQAQALQLRAYLMFADQLMGDFFSQLFHAKDLFSLDTSITKTYFSQYLSDIKDIDKVYRNASDVHSGVPVSLQDALTGSNNMHDYLVESKATFDDRRNRFLDHLLARFAESFNDYVLMLYTSGEKKDNAEIIADKIRFLQEYPVISSERGKGFNYQNDSWGVASNVSGLEKRVARLTGIQNYSWRNLFCSKVISIETISDGSGNNYGFKAEGTNGSLVPITVYDTYEKADAAVNKVYACIADGKNYTIDKEPSGNLTINLRDENHCIVARCDNASLTEEEANAFIADMAASYKPSCDPEGMFLIEHILLRPHFTVPTTDTYELMQVCLDKDCTFCGNEDPYSFRASVILPYWPERFRDMDFRRFLEKTLRTEAPAHISLKICWINYTAMLKFQTIYLAWVLALAAYVSASDNPDNKEKLRTTSNDLVDFLKNVHSEYPEARLHDCDTGTTNPVLLGSTILGTF